MKNTAAAALKDKESRMARMVIGGGLAATALTLNTMTKEVAVPCCGRLSTQGPSFNVHLSCRPPPTMMSDEPSILNVHTPTASFAVVHSRTFTFRVPADSGG